MRFNPSTRGSILGVLLAAVIVVAAWVSFMLVRRGAGPPVVAPVAPFVGSDPLSFQGARTPAYERAAAFGLSHVLYAKSPGGVVAAARRTARFRPLIEAATAGSGVDADTLEAIVLLESAGRPNVIAGADPAHAAGLTQIVAETGTDLLGMRVDLAASRRLTGQIDTAQHQGAEALLRRLRAARRRVDARFAPAEALAGTVRYLTIAWRRFGRDDLAVVSYHMGIGNLEGVLRAYAGPPAGSMRALVAGRDLSWARVYFDSSPTRHRAAWARLNSFGDDSETYYWRVLAAREVMRVFRDDPARLEQLARLQGRGPSAEQALHPADTTRRFADPAALEAAWRRGLLRALPDDPKRLRFRTSPEIARRTGRPGAAGASYRALRPAALRLLLYLANQVYVLGGAGAPLTVTRATLAETDLPQGSSTPVPDSHGALHAAGYAFDIRRRYASREQADAFQYALDRLGSLGLLAWWRGPRAIHVTAASQAATLDAYR